MIRVLLLAVSALALSGCAALIPAVIAAEPVIVQVATDLSAAYALWQTAEGVAQQAAKVSTDVAATKATIEAQAAPIVAAAKRGVVSAASAQALTNLAAQLVQTAAPVVSVTPNQPPLQVAQ